MSHYLGYAIIPVPSPILASPPEGNPCEIDLLVIVSGPTSSRKRSDFTYATIEIPVGAGGKSAGQYLSDSELPAPVYGEQGSWKVTREGGRLTIKPKKKKKKRGKGKKKAPTAEFPTLVFELKGIPVDREPGVVQISVEEQWRNGLVTEPDALQLVKLPNEFPVSDFRAEPAALQNIEPTTLKWKTADAGSQLGFKIEPSNLFPQTFDAADGEKGVETPALGEETELTLVITEHGTEIGRLALSVPFDVPAISPLSRVDKLGSSGRLAVMRWWTKCAAGCEVSRDGKVIDPQAPPLAYRQPYPVWIDGAAGAAKLELTAYGKPGPGGGAPTEVREDWGVEVSDPVTAESGELYCAPIHWPNFVFTPDGRSVALVELVASDSWKLHISLFDATTGARHSSASLNVDAWQMSIDLAEDGVRGVAVGWGTRNHLNDSVCYTLDVENGETAQLLERNNLGGFAITPDGKKFLLLAEDSLLLVPIASPSQPAVLKGGRFNLGDVAISRDGKHAFVINAPDLLVIDLVDEKVETAVPTGLPTSARYSLALSPDGGLLLAIAENGGSCQTLDVAARRATGAPFAVPGVSCGGSVWGASASPAIAPGNAIAVAPNGDSAGGAVLIDLVYRTGRRLPLPGGLSICLDFEPNSGTLAVRQLTNRPPMVETLTLM